MRRIFIAILNWQALEFVYETERNLTSWLIFHFEINEYWDTTSFSQLGKRIIRFLVLHLRKVPETILLRKF